MLPTTRQEHAFCNATSITCSAFAPCRNCDPKASIIAQACFGDTTARVSELDCSENSRQRKSRRCIGVLNRLLSTRTVCYTHAGLFSAMPQAVRGKLLMTNPAEDFQLPRQPGRRFTVFDVEQATLTTAAATGTPRSHLPQILISRTVIFSIENPMTIKETA